MKYMDYFAFLVDEIHSVIAATTDETGLPVTCAIDMMDWDENGLYFLTAKGKNFYHRLKQQKYIALTGMKGEDTMSSIALSIGGKVTEIGGTVAAVVPEESVYARDLSHCRKCCGSDCVSDLRRKRGMV